MSIEPAKLSDSELKHLIANHQKKGIHNTPVYLEALREQAKRTGHGLNFDKSFDVIRAAAANGRFVSYKELADASGADWGRVRYSVGPHLWLLVEYAYRMGWPMLSAIVVNKQNVATGDMEPSTLKGFVGAAHELGLTATDHQAFLREQQRLVFEWAKSQNATSS